MALRRLGRLLVAAFAMTWLLTQSMSPAMAQNQGIQPAGVEIGADGVLRKKLVPDPTGVLTRTRLEEARRQLSADVMRTSPLRKVSLNRLEEAVRGRLEAGQELTSEMLHLAGLTEVRYVFYYPETQDIVIAGPAEGFFPDPAGRTIGMETGKATLLLEDLVAALRAHGPQTDESPAILCSIDPTQDGLKQYQQFLASIGSNINPGDAARIAQGLRDNLGLQTVTLEGISRRSHFAQVLVEADYRMKLIGIGLEEAAAAIPSYVSKARPADVARNGLVRWYFTPDYDCVRVSEDRFALELVGSRVKLIGEDERVTADGVRVAEGKANDLASQAFCTAFTKQYGVLANNSPVFAQLRSCMDLSIVSAYIQQQDFFGKAGWTMDVFGDESKFPIENFEEPRQVETAVNAIWKGNRLMTPLGGGVTIEAWRAIDPARVQVDPQGDVARTRASIDTVDLRDGQWWWD